MSRLLRAIRSKIVHIFFTYTFEIKESNLTTIVDFLLNFFLRENAAKYFLFPLCSVKSQIHWPESLYLKDRNAYNAQKQLCAIPTNLTYNVQNICSQNCHSPIQKEWRYSTTVATAQPVLIQASSDYKLLRLKTYLKTSSKLGIGLRLQELTQRQRSPDFYQRSAMVTPPSFCLDTAILVYNWSLQETTLT